MFNGSLQNDQSIKAHTNEPYVANDKKRVTEGRNTIVVSKKKHKSSFFQRIKEYFSKSK